MKAFISLANLFETLPLGTYLIGMDARVDSAEKLASMQRERDAEEAYERHFVEREAAGWLWDENDDKKDYGAPDEENIRKYGTAYPWHLDAEGSIWLVTYASLDSGIACWRKLYRRATPREQRKARDRRDGGAQC